MASPVITTDETKEAINAVAKALAELRIAKADPYNWKWAIIPLHNAMQNFMVVTLRFTNPVLLARMPGPLRKFETDILTAYNERKLVRELPMRVNPADDKLAGDVFIEYAESLALRNLPSPERRAFLRDTAQRETLQQNILDRHISLLDFQLVDFMKLFGRLHKPKYAPYTPNPAVFPLRTTEAQRHDIGRLNDMRNDFVHFTPKSLTIVLANSGLPRIALSCAEIMLHLVAQGNVLWHLLHDAGGEDVVRRVTENLRAMQDEARAIAAEYGTPI